jgi:hypothetical protein
MKKIFTLLLSFVVVAGVFAQYNHYPKGNHADDRNSYNQPGRHPDFSIRQRDAMIDKINCEYNDRIEAVKFNPCMRFGEKKRTIRRLEKERQQEISVVYVRFNGKKMHGRHFDDRDGYAKF